MKQALYDLNLLFLAYSVLVNGFYLLLMVLSAWTVRRYSRTSALTGYEGVFDTSFYKPVSVIVPAHNEEATIVHTVRSALAVRYPELEVVAVNDGSTDGTLERLVDAFNLVPCPGAVFSDIPCKEIRGLYESLSHPGLRVVDKEQGGKADALNAGINASTFPLVCNIDADSIIDARSMVHITRPFLEDHRVVAVGGVVMPANGCDIVDGVVTKVRVAKNILARFQTIEYLRAFLFGRIGWSRLNALMIVSGAFAIFRRTALVETGGYRTDTVGEDMELVLRMHRVFADKKKPYRIMFLPDPICWTQAPEDMRSLGKQRRRWQRGLADSLVKNRQLCLNPRYGGVGLIGFPFFVLCELLSPVVELGRILDHHRRDRSSRDRLADGPRDHRLRGPPGRHQFDVRIAPGGQVVPEVPGYARHSGVVGARGAGRFRLPAAAQLLAVHGAGRLPAEADFLGSTCEEGLLACPISELRRRRLATPVSGPSPPAPAPAARRP